MDLVYGHMGKPEYDTDSKTWHFTRDASSRRYMHLLCPLMNDKDTHINAVFDGELRQLERSFAGVHKAMLHDFLHFSEAIEVATSQHDPTVSDLIAYGNAADETVSSIRPKYMYKPMIAVASGAAGELLRLIVLKEENLGWKDYKGVELHALTGRHGLEGWWKGSGGKIQQVTFAGKELKASTLVAVRHQGAISILKPKILRNPVCPSNAHGQIQGLPPSRLDANHGVTIIPADMGALPFADVTFDPWNCWRFATIDQAGRWQIWIIKGGASWSTSSDLSGRMNEIDDREDLTPILDGWARVLWVVDSYTLIVASRTAFIIIDIKAKPVDRHLPDLQLAKDSDWILDIKKSPTSQCHLLVLTSSKLLLLEILGAEQRSFQSDAAVILVSWVHFRAHEDVSLSLCVGESTVQRNVLHGEETMVTLYSRINGLASVFAFRYSNLTNQASSMFDPCLLPLPNTGSLPQDPRKSSEDKHSQNPPLCLNLTTVSVGYDSGLDRQEIFDQNEFYLLRMLNHDRSFSEYLYAASTVRDPLLNPPNVQKSSKKKKTPAKVPDDFIVPDGVLDDEASDSAPDATTLSRYGLGEPNQQDTALSTVDAPSNQPLIRSVDMQWLVEEIREKHRVSFALPLDEVLDLIQESITEKVYTVKPGAETLLEAGTEARSITDIDEAAASFGTLIMSVRQSELDMKSADPDLSIMSLLPLISDQWRNDDLLQVYESLVRSEISHLHLGIPGRVRLEREKDLRSVAVQVFLAAYTISIRIKPLRTEPTDETNETNDNNISTQDSNFLLPVREKDSVPSISTRVASLSSQDLDSKRPFTPQSQQVKSQNLPKKPKAGNVDQEFTEDPSSVYLRNLVSLTPQPLLPPKLSNILSHWDVGEDPSFYDWESSQRAIMNSDDETMTDEQVRRDENAMKVKKRARKLAAAENLMDKTVVHTQGESSSQPALHRVIEAMIQGAPPVIASSQILPESSQAGGSLGVSSQPLPGKFAGGKKLKKGRKKGF